MQPLPKEQIFLKNLRKKEIFGLNVLYIYLYRLLIITGFSTRPRAAHLGSDSNSVEFKVW